MKRNLLWKFLLIVLVVLWSAFELYPPNAKNLIDEFKYRADSAQKDKTFDSILESARLLDQERPTQTYGNLRTAIGTTDITRYFPKINVKGELDPTRAILNKVQRAAAGKIRLGLDLQGGQSFLVSLDTSKLGQGVDVGQARAQAIEVLRKRVDKFGVAEPVIQPAGEARILIQMPGLSEAEKEAARVQISKPAFLEFRLVHPQSRELLEQGLIEPNYEVLKEVRTRGDTSGVDTYLVEKKAYRNLAGTALTGKYVKRAMAIRDPMSGSPEITFDLDDTGTQLFAELTRANSGRQMAIVLDGVVASAPRINEPIEGGRVRITGDFDLKSALELASVLENPMETPVKIEEERGVDPSLGADSIKSGINAAIYGTIAVAVFMLVYYLLAGLVANVALLLNIVILLGVMCSVGTTLTLPGIAGVVLTVGMAVDANVLIYERIREELAKGKSMRGALSAGYDRAFGTIFDSHVTTLISSIILIFMGTGTVKGFGVALTIGVAASLFTALVVTRLIFDFLLQRGWLTSLPMLHLIRRPNLDFMKLAKPAFAISWIIILIGCGYGGYRAMKGTLSGVDFAGGDSVTLSFAQKLDVEKIRQTVLGLGHGDPMIQYQRNIGNNSELLAVTTTFGNGPAVTGKLQKDFPDSKFVQLGLDRVGPTVGQEIQRVAIIASLLSLFGILVYVAFRYEFSFAVGAVIAVIHDVLMTFGIFSLAGLELSAPIVAAFLTIIGFSINDTIVIFDRIREDLKLGVRGSFREVVNQALNQTLSRTLITSGTVFLSTMSLYIFGGGAIKDFAFTFLVGIVTGTYSSIYIASALVLFWHKGQRPHLGTQVQMENTAATVRA